MTGPWHVELHSHTIWSKDCVVPFDVIRRLCESRRLDRIAITDHNTADSALAFQQIAPDLVIVGEEIMTTQGELLGYFMRETIPAGLTPQETINRLRAQGAVISVSHPYDRLRKGAWLEADLLAILNQVDAIEIFNARCIYAEDNRKAQRLAHARGVTGTTGSDAHSRVEYGRAYLEMNPFMDAASFAESLKTAHAVGRYSSWLVHMNSSTAKWTRKMGLRKPPPAS